jgi:hypothetical protein
MPSRLSKVQTADHSMVNLKDSYKDLQSTFNRAWGKAPRASIFLTKPQTVTNANGKKVLKTTFNKLADKEIPVPQRRRRRCGKTGISTLLSATAACVAKELEAETQPFRVKNYAEKKQAPALPGASVGAQLLFENVISEVAQTILATAHNIQKSFKKTKNVTVNDIRAAGDIFYDDLAAATSLAPGKIFVLPETRKHKRAVAAAAEGGEGGEGAEAAEAPESGESGATDEAAAVA